MKHKKLFIFLCIVLVCVVFAGGTYVYNRQKHATHNRDTGATAQTHDANTNATADTNTQQSASPQYSLTDPTSIWIIANKTHPLPKGYAPSDLSQPNVAVNPQKSAEENSFRAVAQPALKEMFDAAKADGYSLFMASGYRSEALQTVYYNNYVARDGEAAANRYSAKPGTSEHQTGLALDIAAASRTCYLDECFANMPEGKWLAANAYKYGFVLRYPDGKESETGYMFEPWHYRYVGKELAAQIHSSGQTLEAHFGLL